MNLENTIRIYPWYSFATKTHFWLPVFFLFFLEHLTFEQVLRLEAIYYASVVLLEVPSGHFSDRVGRKITLLISASALCGAYAVFFLSSSFAGFALAQALLATGLSFNSGTDTSLHYDTLAALGRQEEYDDREARVSHLTFCAAALGAVGGGLIGALDLRFAYGLSFLSALTGLVLVTMMSEPPVLEKHLIPDEGFTAQAKRLLKLTRGRTLGYIFGFYVLITVLNHVPHEFYQTYLSRLGIGGSDARVIPPIAGLHVAAAMVVASWFAARSIRFRDRLGIKGTLLTAAGLQVALILLMGLFLSWAVAVLLVFRSVPRALMTAPINAAIAPRVPQHQRATYLSLQSLAGRFAFSGTLVIFSLAGEFVSGDSMTTALLMTSGLGVLGLLWLVVASPHKKTDKLSTLK